MSRPSPARRTHLARRIRSLRGFLPAVQSLESRQLLSSAPLQFDFGTPDSPVAPGYTQVTSAMTYTSQRGFGWQEAGAVDFDFGGPGNTDLTRDGNAVSDNTFLVDLDPGTYDVTPTIGTAFAQGQHEIDVSLSLEGGIQDPIRLADSDVVAPTYRVTVTDGQLAVGLRDDMRYQDPDAGLRALKVTPVDTTAPPGGDAASYVNADTATLGSWKGIYGAQGYDLALDPETGNPSLPTYAALGVIGGSSYLSASSTSDPTALEKVDPGATDRFAADWVSHTSFDIDLCLRDGQEHQVALYVNWTNPGLDEAVQVLDGETGAVLDTRQVDASSGGEYLIWKIQGHVVFRVTGTGGSVAAASGVFLDPATPPPAPSGLTATAAPSTPEIDLSWMPSAQATGYSIERSLGDSQGWSVVATVGVGVTTFADTGLSEATSYSYRVVATNSAGESAPSATLSATTLTAAPTGLTASPISGSLINLSWTDHSSVATTNDVEESADGVNWAQIGSVAASATAFSATGSFNRLTTYEFRVRAYSSGGGYSTYATTSATTPAYPDTPAINWAAPQSSTSVALSWTDAPGEAGFRIERSSDGGSTWAVAGTVATGVTTFTDTGLAEATSYTYRIFATNGSGDSIPSATQAAATPPGAPSGLAAVLVSGGQINLSWTDQSTAAAYYVVQHSPNGSTGWVQIGTVNGSSANSYAATGSFSSSTTYYFRVSAYAYTGGTSAYASTSITTPASPGQPTLNSATAQSDTAVVLAWSDVAGEAGFRVERSTNNGSTWTTAGTVGAGITTFTDTGLTEATSYTYRVTATNAVGASPPSTTRSVVTPPSAPSGLTATAVSGGQINLTWTDHSAAASSYYVEQSTNGTTWTQIALFNGNAINSDTATGPFNGSTTYYFRVHAYASTGGNSAYATASVTTPAFPNQPAITSATAQSDTAVALTWSDVAGETGFLVERSTNNGTTWTTAGTVGAGVTSFTDTGLSESTSYTYRVTATNAVGSSAASATRSVATPPSAPSGLTASAISPTQINLAWTDHSAAATYNYVEQSTNGTTWTQIASLYGNATNSYTATGPFNGSTTYYFRVHAYALTGANSAYATATVTTPGYPSQPTIGAAVAQSDTVVTLTWSDVAGETGFRIERLVSGTWTAMGTVGTGVTSFTDTGLHEVTSYSYRLFATNAVGDSAPSATVSVMTLPAAPTGLTATAVSWKQINLSWTDHSTVASSYYVEQSTNGTTWTQIASVNGSTTNSDTATGPFNGSTTYYFRVRDYSVGYSTYATTSVITPAFPNAPTLTSATPQSDTSITLAWQDVAGETGFRVERLVSGVWTAVGTVGAGVTMFTDTGLHEATSYSYHVVATNSAGDSAPSATLSATTLTAAPTGLTASPISGSLINLSWTDHSSVA
ncbi:MAG: fibronectin type III domain-containing protein, partial [Isosphaeraceae bacterium]|nr:fibronectin type III domain-containing protein [Isosphaeraceae bacterium]